MTVSELREALTGLPSAALVRVWNAEWEEYAPVTGVLLDLCRCGPATVELKTV